MPIKVSLDTSLDPPVTVDPTTEKVDHGYQTITWVPAPNQPPFTFHDVQFLIKPNPFSRPTITTNPVKMTVTENNTSSADHPYIIYVKLNGTIYNSKPKKGGTGGGGTPVIHNN